MTDLTHKIYNQKQNITTECVEQDKNVVDTMEPFDLKEINLSSSTVIFGKDTPLKFNLIKNLMIQNMEKYDQCFLVNFPMNQEFEQIVGERNMLQYNKETLMFIQNLMDSNEHNKKTLLVMNDPGFVNCTKPRLGEIIYSCQSNRDNISIVTSFDKFSKDSDHYFIMSDYCFVLESQLITTSPYGYNEHCEIELQSGSYMIKTITEQLEMQKMALVSKRFFNKEDCFFKYNLVDSSKKCEKQKETTNSTQSIMDMLKAINKRIVAIENIVNMKHQKNENIIERTQIPSIREGMCVLIEGKTMSGRSTLILDLIEKIGYRYKEIYLDTSYISGKSLVNIGNLRNTSEHDEYEIVVEILKKQKMLKGASGDGIPDENRILVVLDDFSDWVGQYFDDVLIESKNYKIDFIISLKIPHKFNSDHSEKYADLIMRRVETNNEKQIIDIYKDIDTFCGKKTEFPTLNDFTSSLKMSVKKDYSWLCLSNKKYNDPLKIYESEISHL